MDIGAKSATLNDYLFWLNTARNIDYPLALELLNQNEEHSVLSEDENTYYSIFKDKTIKLEGNNMPYYTLNNHPYFPIFYYRYRPNYQKTIIDNIFINYIKNNVNITISGTTNKNFQCYFFCRVANNSIITRLLNFTIQNNSLKLETFDEQTMNYIINNINNAILIDFLIYLQDVDCSDEITVKLNIENTIELYFQNKNLNQLVTKSFWYNDPLIDSSTRDVSVFNNNTFIYNVLYFRTYPDFGDLQRIFNQHDDLILVSNPAYINFIKNNSYKLSATVKEWKNEQKLLANKLYVYDFNYNFNYKSQYLIKNTNASVRTLHGFIFYGESSLLLYGTICDITVDLSLKNLINKTIKTYALQVGYYSSMGDQETYYFIPINIDGISSNWFGSATALVESKNNIETYKITI